MVEIAKGVFWIGHKHWSLRSFHGSELSTHRASTYNAYAICDSKVALVDTVWDPFKEEWVESIGRDLGFSNIDMVVVNHAEPDHAGSLGLLMEKLPPGTPVYCTKSGELALRRYFGDPEWNFNCVKTGSSVSLGEYELSFIEAKMLHWPDVMITYVKGAGVALTSDAFGQHFCTSGFFNDEVDPGELRQEAIKYFANILSPYSPLVARKVAEIEAMGLDIRLIAPSHGVIWRDDPTQALRLYSELADSYSDGSVVVAYDGFYCATEKMAKAIVEGVARTGARYLLAHTAESDMSDLLTSVFCAKAVIVGSSAINNSVHRTTAALLDEIKGHKPRGKLGAAFGSYGWSGEAPKIAYDALAGAGLEMIGEPIRSQYSPNRAELDACAALGETVARMALERSGCKRRTCV